MKTRKILSMFLTLVLLMAMMPTAAFAIDAGTGTEKAIQRVGRIVDDATPSAANIAGAQASSVYFGTYPQSGDGQGGYNTDPIKWRVLSNAGGKLLLLSDQDLDAARYHEDYESVTWETSTIRSWLNGYGSAVNQAGTDYSVSPAASFFGTAFTTGEQAAIPAVTVVNDNNPEFDTAGGDNTTDKLFLLSIAEATTTGFGFTDNYSDTDVRKAGNTDYAKSRGIYTNSSIGCGDWWLRSPGISGNYAALVSYKGNVHLTGYGVGNHDVGVRPAFNIDLKSVLFTSAANGGKAGEGALAKVGDYSGSDWKLTLRDDGSENAVGNGHKDFKAEIVGTDGDPWKWKIQYSGAKAGENEYISAVIHNGDEFLYYGRLCKAQADPTDPVAEPNTITVDLSDMPLDDNESSGWNTLCLFNEQYNGDYNTDYASGLKQIKAPTIMTLEAETVAVGEDAVIIAHLPEPATGTVTLTVNGTSYTVKIEDGRAVLTISGLDAGTYTVEASYSGDDSFTGCTASAELTVLPPTPISVTATDAHIGEQTQITVNYPADADTSMTGIQGHPAGLITIYIDGMEIDTLNGENGVLNYSINIDSSFSEGTHTIRAVFNGDGKYSSNSASTSFNVLPPVEYPLWVGGVQVTSLNKGDILNDGGTASYDPDTTTLTLNNATITATSSYQYGDSGTTYQNVVYASGLALTVSLSGSNILGDGSADLAIMSDNGSLAITGGGSLTASGSLWANDGISITGSTVIATGSGLGIDSIFSRDGVTITDSTVTATGSVRGITAFGNLTVSGNSVVTAEGGTQAIYAVGVTLNDGLGYTEGSANAKKAVISKPATYTVTVTPGANMTKVATSGAVSQTVTAGDVMADVVYTAADGYYFPTDYTVAAVNGVTVTRDSFTQITVSGTPTADAAITLTAPTAKAKEATPALVATQPSTIGGKGSIPTTTAHQKSTDGTNWTDCSGVWEDLSAGTYYVRVKATDTTLASDTQTITINAFVPAQEATPTATFTANSPDSGTLSGVAAGMTYAIDDGAATAITGISIDLTGLVPCTITVIQPGNGTTTVDSDPQSITVTKAETPSLTATQPTVINGTGSIPTTTAHEFSKDGTTWTPCTGETSGLAAGTYYIRVKAAGTVLASDAQTITINAFVPAQEATPTATFTANGPDSGTLSGVAAGMTYAIDDGAATAITGTSIDLTGLVPCTITVIQPGNGTTTVDSDPQTITVSKAATLTLTATQPSTIGGTGSIPTTTAHEFSKDGTTWTPCTGETTGLGAGTYYIRVKASGTALASEAQSITINAFVPEKESTPAATLSITIGDDGKLVGVGPGMQYSFDGVNWTDITEDGISITDLKPGTLYIKKLGNGTTTVDSDPQAITITKAEAPILRATDADDEDGSGSVIHTTAAHEISSDGGKTWSPCTGPSNDLEPETYLVRVAAAGTVLASEPVTVTIKYEPTYTILNGEGSSWTEGSGEQNGIEVRCSGKYKEFIGIQVDGKDVDKSLYSSREGSTIVTLPSAYLKTLAKGDHTLTFLYKYGTASTTFTVIPAAAAPDDELPPTGDSGYALWIVMAAAAIIVMFGTVYIGRKRRKS